MKRSIRRIISLVLCVLLGVSAVVITASGVDTDIPTLNKSTVFIDGYPDGTFLPDKAMTRAEAIKVVSVVARYTSSFKANSIKTKFTDMADTEWYAPNVKYLEQYGLLDFFGTKLEASKGITRGEFVKLISAYIPVKSGKKAFPDVPATHPYYDAIIAAAKAGIVEGNPDGTFNPDGTLTRAQIVTIIDRLIERNAVDSNAKKINKFSDIKGHWAEGYVIAASCTNKVDGKVVWYSGNAYSANSPVDKTKLDYSLTQSILGGVDISDSAAVEKAIEAKKNERIAEIRNTPTTVKPAANKKAYYVSNSGNDANDGLTPEKAWKTLEKVSGATLKSGDVVYFKRGDTFRGVLETKYGVTYSAYGEGAKPNLYASLRNYAGSDYWKPTDKTNVYVSSDTFEDVGNLIFNEGEMVGLKKTKGINGTELLSDLDFHHNTTDKKVYLYSESNPNTRFYNIEICRFTSVVRGNGNNVTLDNLCLKYAGESGVDYGSGTTKLTVQNCEIGFCGGSLQGGKAKENGDIVRLGNGVGTHGGCSKYYVDNCYVYEAYDAGLTFQYFKNLNNPVMTKMVDIRYTNNVIEKCTYAIEYINGQPEDKGLMQDITFSGNFLIHSGSGWGKQRPDRPGSTTAVLKGWGGVNHSKNFLIYDNVIMTKDSYATLIHMCVDDAKNMPELTGNIFANVRGQKFGLYGTGSHNRDDDMIKYDEKILDTTIGLDDNTFVFLEK